MKKVEVFLGETTMLAYRQALISIKPLLNNLEEKILIVVPDKLSLLTEKSIFNLLDTEAYFNIEVMGINTFVQKILSDCNLDIFCYSKEQSLMLIHRAIQNVKDDFLCFGKKLSQSFCEEMFGTISQLKTSMISSDEFFVNNENLNLNKFHDIKLVYDEYTRLLDGKQDSGELLTLFNSFAKDSKMLKNSTVMFLGFDSLTNQGISAMETIIKFAKAFIISVAKSNSKNSRIYDTTILNSLQDIARKNNTEVNYSVCRKNVQSLEKNYLLENIYSGKISSELETNEHFHVVKATNMQDEVIFAGKTIVYQIKQKQKSFSDFAIICPQDYLHLVRRIFNEYNIHYFLDQPRTLYSFDYIEFIIAILSFFDEKSLENFKKILYFDFLNIDKTIIDILDNYYNKNEILDLPQIQDIVAKENIQENQKITILNLINNLIIVENNINLTKNSNNLYKICDLYNILLEIFKIFDLENCINNTSKVLEENGELYLSKSYSQIFQKLNDLLNSITSMLSEEEISLFDYIDLLSSVTKTKTVKTVPISLDSVQVIDPSGYIENVNTVFILGANEGMLPISIKDQGLISDKESENLNLNMSVGPTVKTINKRNKYKLFESLFFAENHLYISYHEFLPDGKDAFCSNIVNDIISCYKNFKFISTKSLFSFLDTAVINEEKFLFNSVNYKSLKNNFGMLEYGKTKNLVKNILMDNGNSFSYNKNEDIENAKELFFKNNTTKVSLLEKYFNCPKANYFAYGLKLQRSKSKDTISADYGTFIHKILESFIKFFSNKLEILKSTEILSWINNEFEYLSNIVKYKNVFKKSNAGVLSLIKDELFSACSLICEEQKISKFKVNKDFLEYKFSGNSFSLETTYGVFNLVGIIDRVDFCNDYFRIIDYKTGANSSYDGIKDIFVGKKIQTMLYYKALENITAKKCFGAFYMPIRFGYKKPTEHAYRMKGIYLNDVDLVLHADTTLKRDATKSMLFNTSLTNDRSKISGLEKGAMSSQDFTNISTYTKALCEQALNEISSGFISSTPSCGACEYCEFNDICKDFKKDEITRKLDFKVDKISFLKEENNGI